MALAQNRWQADRRLLMAMIGSFWLPVAALAQEGPLLTVTDAAGRAHRFDRAALDRMPQIGFETGTLWTEGVSRFSGPSLRHVLAQAGVVSGQIRLIALNEYSVDMPMEALTDAAPILATRRDGSAFAVRDNGPLWVIYPFDSDLAYQTEEVYAASIWQLVEVRALAP